MTVRRLETANAEATCLAWLEACRDTDRPALLLSGGPGGASARYHILARQPRWTVHGSLVRTDEGGDGRVHVADADGDELEVVEWEDLFPLLRRRTAEHGSPARLGSDEVPFRGGLIGYFGYDLAWLFEYGLPRFLPPSSQLPDLWLGFYDAPVVIDRRDGTVHGPDAEVAALLELDPPRAAESLPVVDQDPQFHREEYEAAVDRIREHCLRGDLFQADLSRRIALRIAGSSRDLFKRLLAASPAPFMSYIGLGEDRAVVSSSPEEFLSVRGSQLRTRPIKGTRPRGADAESDARMIAELMQSEKDLAELTMIVDLMRNDLGRVAEPGSVEVTEFPVHLTLPQVHHLYASIEARLEKGRDIWDLLGASFPPGSISGAPKPKAIEILEIVERTRRGVYTGAIGYIEPGGGNVHLNVAIRTAEFVRGEVRFGVGGGITALSEPEAEFEETVDKARGLAIALGLENVQ